MRNDNLDERKLRVEFFSVVSMASRCLLNCKGISCKKCKSQKAYLCFLIYLCWSRSSFYQNYYVDQLRYGETTSFTKSWRLFNTLGSVFLCVFSFIDDKLRHINIVRYTHCQSGCGNHVTLASD